MIIFIFISLKFRLLSFMQIIIIVLVYKIYSIISI
uniref:Uncharacterized protein n=1 Tax=Podoviridae sp. ctZkC8 TaxID=2825259 RepID=A0A8S5UBU5_9CAUD|nr:MAG TPA: hypothetical protein [Podoviridae sp. ctZkC8]